MGLQEEIDEQRKEIQSDGYPMSIGELVNLYRERELDLHPEFQRFYRWTSIQKSRWIESILLGIPLPSIFVVQRKDGVWDVIDGLQRLSTILEFMGELRQEDGTRAPHLVLERTKFLPSLAGKTWKGSNRAMTPEQQRYIKRAKLDIKIIQRESDESAKYELFQRLNTGGTPLSDQEVRSCILISLNRDWYRWALELSTDPSFRTSLPLSERLFSEQYDLELVIRFLVLRNMDPQRLAGARELGEFLTEEASRLAQTPKFPYAREAKVFRGTFELIASALEDNAFRRFDQATNRFAGPFLISAFEVIALGIGYHFPQVPESPQRVADLVKKQVWSRTDFLTSTGVSATQRLPKTIPHGRKVFKP